MERHARQLERELAEAKRAYLDVADAVCRESTGPEDVCNKARDTRKQLQDMTDQFFAVSQESAALRARNATLCQANAALEQDRERLDAIEKLPVILCAESPGWSSGHTESFKNYATKASTIRFAIDAAVAAAPHAGAGEGRG